MKIGIIGVGHIGKTLAIRLSAAGHSVKVANSKEPESIDSETLSTGAKAVFAKDAVKDVEVIILSIPFQHNPKMAGLLADVPEETVVIDTSNYYPHRDGNIEAIDAGQVESVWVAEKLGRPIAKAWNAIGAGSLADRDKPAGSPDRIAIPIAADRDTDREVTMSLVNESGVDAFDAGSIADSWRLQPGAPVYCTDLRLDEMAEAVAAAEKERISKRRDLAGAILQERFADSYEDLTVDYLVRLNRVLYM
ncbi:NADP oxidoreductase [Rufibacter sp. DG15C]|uniref:NADPH-dependent F420 reductase n=1 Tax=Rufibacter sp. DG15C TaxID=1379909 RepID=UPI00078E155D|nr:NAD(P)-binding domain-containing protein [Rufibacter sp. DG15C]AMM49902.1 NADP oxidoreductase [Rufibacter sp. DG15C]